jgi:phosphate transport system protein
MVFEWFKSQSGSAVEGIERQIAQMFVDSEEVLRLAVSAFDPDVVAREIGKRVRNTDRQVNRAERSIRRELLVHASLHGGANLPLVLVYMSIIKDIERLGDYAKNIWDVAVVVEDLPAAPDLSEFGPLFDRTIALVSEIADIYSERDSARAIATLKQCDEWLDEFDTNVEQWMASPAPSTEGVPKALLNRHLKRITAHLMNVLTAVVMPVDRLDYWDEDKADRI